MGFMGDLRNYCQSRASEMNLDFSEWEDHAREIRDYILPWSGRGLSDQGSEQETSGRKRMQYIYDATATVGIDALSAGIFSNMTSPSKPWFGLGTPVPSLMENYSVKLWLDEVERIMYDVFRRSNLYQSLRMGFMELPSFGTFAMAVLEDDEKVIHCEPYTFGEYRLGQSDRYAVNVFYRKFYITVRQCVEWWGLDKVGTDIRLAYEEGKRLEKQVCINHLIEPNDPTTIRVKEALDRPWRSLYWLDGIKGDKPRFNFLEIGGFNEFPILAPRWRRNGNRVYGESPAMVALPDIKQLQLETKDKITLIGKMANPPKLATGLKWGDIDTGENGISFANSGQQTLQNIEEVNPQALVAVSNDIADLRNRINRELNVDLFRMLMDLRSPQMTAREVTERASERLQLLGPVVEALSTELLDPLIDRTFNILLRRGLLPPIPEELSGTTLTVNYISPLAQAQRMVGVNALERFLAFAGGVIATRPEAADKIDADQILENGADGYGVDTRVLKPQEAVNQIRSARAQAAAQERAVALEQQAAEGAKLLSETQVTEDQNALQGMIGG